MKKLYGDQVLEVLPKCQWFIKKYFNKSIFEDLLYFAMHNKEDKLKHLLNEIWFKLPDSFNIVNNPPGYKEFLNLIEE